MPNIYLRLPFNRCQYLRHRDPSHVLTPDEPIVFSQFMPEFWVLRNYLTNTQAVVQHANMQCFSHQQWQNMKNGRSPFGGKMLLKRNCREHLSYDEVRTLNGYTEFSRSDKEDYLCIKLPTEIVVVDAIRHVTPSWNLTYHGIRQLIVMLNNDFKRSLVEWALSTFDFCTSEGRIVCRSQSAMMERWLMRYGIDPTDEEKDNMRRVVDRWIKTGNNHFSAYSCFNMRYEDDKEQRRDIANMEWE